MRRLSAFATLLFLLSRLADAQGSADRDLEKKIDQRNRDSVGIVVDEPKVFDDSLLQQMLNAAEAKLASMQVLDASGLASRLGSVSGGQQTVNGLAISAQTPSMPQVATVANGATNSTVTTTSATPSQVTTAAQPVTNVTTTVPQFNPPGATAPTPSTSLPTAFNVSSSNVLNEQMQLTYEIANLRLLLEGSLSDRLLKSSTLKVVKPRTTIGLSVTVTPRYKDAVAIVEVTVEKGTDLGDPEPPVVTALLPREKTYNVASIRESNISVGLGAVTQVFGVSGSFLHGSRSYYLVQDQDTVALPIPVADNKKDTAFLWQFRPVLGRHYLSTGTKQVFVQLAFPTPWTENSFGTLSVTTYWCHYDQGKGLVGKVIAGSLRKEVVKHPVPNLKLELPPDGFSVKNMEDLGNGQMLVRLPGHFLTDTSVRIGSTAFASGANGAFFSHDAIEFVASISDLATKKVVLVARDGSEIPVEIKHMADTEHPRPPPCIDTGKSSVTSVDETNSLVSVQFKDARYLHDSPPLVFTIGNRVFGYRDAAFLPDDGTSLRAIVPTALLLANPAVTVKPLFAPDEYAAQVIFPLTPFGQPERVALLEQGKDTSTFLLYGSRLAQAKILSPAVELKPTPDMNSLRQFDLTADQIKAHKQILLQRGAEHPILVAMPAAASGGSQGSSPQQVSVNATVDVQNDATQSLTAQAPATVGADQATFTGANLNNLQTVIFNGKTIGMEVSADGKSVVLKGLKASQVTAAAVPQVLQFIYKANMVPVKLDVVEKK